MYKTHISLANHRNSTTCDIISSPTGLFVIQTGHKFRALFNNSGIIKHICAPYKLVIILGGETENIYFLTFAYQSSDGICKKS